MPTAATSPLRRWAGGALVAAALLLLPTTGLLPGGTAHATASAPPIAVEQSLTVQDTTDVQQALDRIDRLRAQGAFDEAQAALDRLAGRSALNDSVRAAVYWRRARTFVDQGERAEGDARQRLFERALADAETAVKADTTSAQAHLALAIAEGRVALDAGTRERIKRSRAVRRHADRALALDSTLSAAYHVRGRWHYEVASLGFFERAIVNTVYGGLPDASYESAVDDFERAIRYEDAVVHHLELGRTYLKLDQREKARAELQAALALPNDNPDDPGYKDQARKLLERIG
jgi:tetratricopeptide (TPR) repeat protein